MATDSTQDLSTAATSQELTPDSAAAELSPAASPAGEKPFPSEDEVRAVLSEVYDPELGISVIDLGLIYKLELLPEENTVNIDMTLTSPGCPLGPEISSAAYLAVTRLEGVDNCTVNMVWTPVWDPTVNLTEEARAALGIW